MIVRYPTYWPEFHCAAGSCSDTCCQGWDIAIDPATLARYRNAENVKKTEFKKAIDFKKQRLVFQKGVCPFLDGSGLCRLQKSGGPQMISRACRLYPRHAEEYGNRREWSLSFSCPEAARLILGKQEPLSFAEKKLEAGGRPDSEADGAFLSLLLRIRRHAVGIAQDRRFLLGCRIAMVLGLAGDIQKRLDQGKGRGGLDKVQEYLSRFQGADAGKMISREKWLSVQKTEKEREDLLLRYRDTLYEFPIIEKKWKGILGRLRRWESENWKGLQEQRKEDPFGLAFEHIFVSYLELYLPGAVYDRDILSKAKMAAYHCLALHMLEKALGIPAEKWIHIYAREIEHSAENLDLLENMVKSRDIFGLEAMAGCALPPKNEENQERERKLDRHENRKEKD